MPEDLELTPWFSGKTPPIRPGFYERKPRYPRITFGRRFAYFDGSCWMSWGESLEQAEQFRDSPSGLIAALYQWRGIFNPSENPS